MIYLKKAFIVENEMFSFFMTGIRGNLVAVCYLLHEPEGWWIRIKILI